MIPNLLRLINDEGEIVREWESDVVWRQQWITHGDSGFSSFHGRVDGRDTSIIPADHLTIELTIAERVPA